MRTLLVIAALMFGGALAASAKGNAVGENAGPVRGALSTSAKGDIIGENAGPVRNSVSLPGRYVQALLVVAEYRAKDRSLSKTEKDLSNFEIHVVEFDADLLEVHYLPRAKDKVSKDGWDGDRTGNTPVGRALAYGLQGKDLHVEWVKSFR